MKILITGGAGYIGSHAAVSLANNNHEIVIVDNLSSGTEQSVTAVGSLIGKAPVFFKRDIRDKAEITRIIQSFSIDIVLHFAGFKSVNESCIAPVEYFSNNVVATHSLIEAMNESGVKKIVFSSSATVYGNPMYLPIDEEHPVVPITPYGRNKRAVEEYLSDICNSDKEWSAVCLRYFNPAGAHHSGDIGEGVSTTPGNLFPVMLRAARAESPKITIFGRDYNTVDGTGVRDYVHIDDLVDGHLAALKYCAGNSGWTAVNLGTGQGSSVLEVISTFEAVTGTRLTRLYSARRIGDVAESYASVDKAKKILNWSAKKNIRQMCASSWNYQKKRESVL
jgi:UDP-glucose 4-epimerase